jgi:YedE family putative selenium metabolism protein
LLAFIKKHNEILMILAAGAAIGALGAWLSYLGNPRNSGICISCFMENLAGSLGLHGNARMQYIRPELVGFVLGGAVAAFVSREFKAEGGSSPIIRFLGGALLIVGCSIFLGCPIKMVLRLTAGDWTALAGVAGLVVGVWVGFQFLKRGFYLGDSSPLPIANGLIIPLVMAGLLAAMLVRPGFLHMSLTGPGSQRAPLAISAGAGLFIGFLAQRSRFCVTGSIGNFVVSGDRKMLSGLVSMLAFAFLVSLYTGSFTPGVEGQPGSHLSYGWSFLGMALVGITSVMIGGCPFRQLILAGQGSADAGAAVLGMVAGGAIVQGWGITSSNMGPTVTGQVATLAGLAFVLALGLVMRVRE